MCGIYGFAGFANEKLALKMKTSMIHRGPDASGVFTSSDGLTTLGHNRLSIIDLSTSAEQPIFNENKNLVLVFNGEIYNYKELRSVLIEKGYKFKSQGDSEVIIHGFEEYGRNLVNKLRGMFSFAIYNKSKDELFIARDHFGIKPLYYSKNSEKFIFASELKALTEYKGLNKDLDYTAISDHLTFLWCPAPKTILSNVKKLPPGHYMVYTKGEITAVTQFYKQDYSKPYNAPSIKDAIKEVDRLFRSSVEEQLVSDVPLGLFLSGGLDSSIIAAYVRDLYPDKPIKAFTIDIQSGDLDGAVEDLPYAKKVAAHLNIDLEIIKVSPMDVFRYIEEFIYIMDEPLADPAAINVILITKIAREQGYKVLLGGTGGDDIFSGYRRHKGIVLDQKLFKAPKALRKVVEKCLGVLKANNPKIRRLKKFSYGIGSDLSERVIKYFSWIPEEKKMELFSDTVKQKLTSYSSDASILNKHKKDLKSLENLDSMLLFDSKYFLVDHNLNYTDKMSMFNSIESRVPFLDYRMVNYVDKLPENYKFREGHGKWILKKLAEKYLPHEIIYRPKTGFGSPLRKWVKGDLKPLFEKYMNKQIVKSANIFDYDAINKLIKDNEAGKVDASYTLFSLLCIHIWLKKFKI